MAGATWEVLADRFADTVNEGSLRDVLILDAELSDWQALLDLLHDRRDWTTSYTEDGEPSSLPGRAEVVLSRAETATCSFTVTPATLIINGYVFGPGRIEFDVAAEEVDSAGRFDELLDFVAALGQATRRRVTVSSEAQDDAPFLAYEPDLNEVRAIGSPAPAGHSAPRRSNRRPAIALSLCLVAIVRSWASLLASRRSGLRSTPSHNGASEPHSVWRSLQPSCWAAR